MHEQVTEGKALFRVQKKGASKKAASVCQKDLRFPRFFAARGPPHENEKPKKGDFKKGEKRRIDFGYFRGHFTS